MTIDRLPTVRRSLFTVCRSLFTVHYSLLVGFLLLTAAMMGGCASTHDEIAYYDPNWLTDGRIIAGKSVTTFSDEGLPGYGRSSETSHSEYIVSMKDDGTDERSIYGGKDKSIAIPVASPLGNYIAYKAGNFIKIISSDGSNEVKSIDCGEPLNSFDWSPDETRIVYSGNSSKNLFVLNVSNEVKEKIAPLAYKISWRKGDKILYEGATQVFSLNQDGTGSFEVVNIGAMPEKITANEIVYVDSLFNVHQINIDGTSDKVLFSNYKKATLNLSFDGTKIVGGDLSQSVIEGIWVVNIDGTNINKLK